MLQINQKLRLVKQDENNLVLEELKDVQTKNNGIVQKWQWYGYYGSVKGALTSALHKILFDSVEQKMEIKELIELIDMAEQDIINAIKNQGE